MSDSLASEDMSAFIEREGKERAVSSKVNFDKGTLIIKNEYTGVKSEIEIYMRLS